MDGQTENPNARYGTRVPEGGPPPKTLHKELQYITDKFKNISDEDLYRIYKERWANPDRLKSGWKTSETEYIPLPSIKHRHDKLVTKYRHSRRTKNDAIDEYRHDQHAIDRERLIHYLLDPEQEMLEDDAILGALFPDIESAKYPAYEMHKYKIKIEELHPYIFSIWDNVKAFYLRNDRIDNLLKQDEKLLGGIDFSDPIQAYEADYDPLNALLKSARLRRGDLMNYGNLAHETDKRIHQLYDTGKIIKGIKKTKWSNEHRLKPLPPTNFFLKYAYAKLEKARQNQDRLEEEYWVEITRPFEYEPKSAPLDRPIFIEVPKYNIIRSHDPHLAASKRDGIGLPKVSSMITFDFISFPENNPTTIIDSTYRLGTPMHYRMGVDFLPKCLSLSLQRATPGMRYNVTCPPRLLFGYNGWPERGYPPQTPITFDIEVRDVEDPSPAKSNVIFYDDANQNSIY